MTNDQMQELDKELAELLGWHRIMQGNFYGDTSRFVGDNPSLNIVNGFIPRWTQDDGAAFRLAVDNNLEYVFDDESIAVYDSVDELKEWSNTEIKAFPDIFSAVRVAIVQATINKLKGNK